MKSEDYAYWSGRLATALRAVVDNPGDFRMRIVAIATLSGYDVLTKDSEDVEGLHIARPLPDLTMIDEPYPDGPLASRRVERLGDE
jgi:hypothetical protein